MNDIKEIFLSPESPIIQAIRIIDVCTQKIALAVDEQGRLIGSITDGDIRRGLLKGIGLQDPVHKVMTKPPIYVKGGMSREDLVLKMKENFVQQLPIVDDSLRVIGMELTDDLLKPERQDHWVILMVGGLGMRLRPLTNATPKPLLKVGEKPILETILENFIDYGFCQFYFSVNYKNEQLKEYFGDGNKWNVKIRYLEEKQMLGTAGALRLLPEKPSKTFLVMNGDLLTKINFSQLLSFHANNKSQATICVKEYDFQVPYGVVNLRGHEVSGIDEKPVHHFFVNAGIYVLEPEVLDHLPDKQVVDMPELLNASADKQLKISAFPIREYWIDIGSKNDLQKAKIEFSEIFKNE